MHYLVRYNSVTFGKFGKHRQGAKEQLKLHPNCELCLQQINRAKGTSKKHTTVEGFWQHLEGQDADVQLADLHRWCRRHDLSFTCRLFVACVASVSALVCSESWDESLLACYAGCKQSYVRHETKPLHGAKHAGKSVLSMNHENFFIVCIPYNNFVRINLFGSDGSFLTRIGMSLTNSLHFSQIHHIYAVSYP